MIPWNLLKRVQMERWILAPSRWRISAGIGALPIMNLDFSPRLEFCLMSELMVWNFFKSKKTLIKKNYFRRIATASGYAWWAQSAHTVRIKWFPPAKANRSRIKKDSRPEHQSWVNISGISSQWARLSQSTNIQRLYSSGQYGRWTSDNRINQLYCDCTGWLTDHTDSTFLLYATSQKGVLDTSASCIDAFPHYWTIYH